MRKSILLVEDETGLRLTLSDSLEAEGFDVVTAPNGLDGLKAARDRNFDILLLDVMLPGMDGFKIAKTLRDENCLSPIIMLTAKSQLDDKITGLRLGADDYMTKPFAMDELLARIDAQLRRSDAAKQSAVVKTKSSNIAIDLKRGYISTPNGEQQLWAQEIKLLNFFYQHEGEVVSRETLLEVVWGYTGDSSTRTIDVHIARLRQKLGDVGDVPQIIQTVRGHGYKFIAP